MRRGRATGSVVMLWRGALGSSALFAAVVLTLGAALALPGCAADPRATSDSPTRGWTLRLSIAEQRVNRYVVYDLQSDGTLVYLAGDQTAVTGGVLDSKPTWTGRLSSDEAGPIVAHLENTPSPQAGPRGEGEGAYRVVIRPPGGWSREVEGGASTFLMTLRAQLESVVKRRRASEFDPLLK